MSVKKPAFFEDPANEDLLHYIIKYVRNVFELDGIIQCDRMKQTEVIPYAKSERVLEMDHEYRMKQLDVDIAMVDVKKLELQIELLKLQKGL